MTKHQHEQAHLKSMTTRLVLHVRKKPADMAHALDELIAAATELRDDFGYSTPVFDIELEFKLGAWFDTHAQGVCS